MKKKNLLATLQYNQLQNGSLLANGFLIYRKEPEHQNQFKLFPFSAHVYLVGSIYHLAIVSLKSIPFCNELFFPRLLSGF